MYVSEPRERVANVRVYMKYIVITTYTNIHWGVQTIANMYGNDT